MPIPVPGINAWATQKIVPFLALLFNGALDSTPEQAESEPNDRPEQANHVTLPATIKGTLDKPGDADYFSFDAQTGQSLVFDVAARSIKSKAAPGWRSSTPPASCSATKARPM